MVILSFYDYTGEAVKPWAEQGYVCYCFDIQHEGELPIEHGDGWIVYVNADLHSDDTWTRLVDEFKDEDVVLVMGFPVCTDLAVSGAVHWAKKLEQNKHFQHEAAQHAMRIADFADEIEAPYMIENPVGRLSTLWRKPNFYFHPFEYGGYIPEAEAEHPIWPDYIAPRDAYSKKTGIWCSSDFEQPRLDPVECESFGKSKQFSKLGGKSLKTKNIRSATPRGFALAVYEANS